MSPSHQNVCGGEGICELNAHGNTGVVAVPRPGWSQNERKNTVAKGRQQVDQPPVHNNQQKSEAPAVVIKVAKTSIQPN
jgi:hypothetical protein